MFEKLRARIHIPSPATGIALLALFVALGGTGYAAAKLANNSVGTKQLKNNAVTGAKVKNGSLTAADFGGTLPAGPKGDAGTNGAKGDPGTNGSNGTNGNDGQPGSPGTPGTNGSSGATVKAKMQSSGTFDSSTTNPNPIPLTNNAWTQKAGNPAQLDIKFDWTPPSGTCGGPMLGGAVTIKDNNVTIFSALAPGGAFGQQIRTVQHIFAPGSDVSHVFTAEVGDNCTNAPDFASVGQIQIDATEFAAP